MYEYIKTHPIVFAMQLLLLIALSISIEAIAGGICIFRHGKMNIEDFTEQSYFLLAGSSLRISTEFTRQTGWLPGNQAGDSLCTYGAER